MTKYNFGHGPWFYHDSSSINVSELIRNERPGWKFGKKFVPENWVMLRLGCCLESLASEDNFMIGSESKISRTVG